MYRGFNLQLTNEFQEYRSSGKKQFTENKEYIKNKFEECTDQDGNILAENIMKSWFPNSNFDIFISHSHKDINKVLSLSGYLYKKFGLTCFVDSQFWDFCDDLLRKIDDKYCYNKKSKTYNYKKRNSTTAHVHNMLSVALTEIMDKCECAFFINTKNSTIQSDKIFDKYSESDSTYSPWIYYEISMLRLIKIKIPIRDKTLKKSYARADSISGEAYDSAPIKYPLDLSKLTPLNDASIFAWNAKYRQLDSTFHDDKKYPLDVLYKMFPPPT